MVVHGSHWAEAHEQALSLCRGGGGAMIHPFEGETTWTGHGTLVAEIQRQLPRIAAQAGYNALPPGGPGCILLSVGGGGLLLGALAGCEAAGWSQTAVIAVETLGADSLARAVAARSLVTLPGITSIASSLGAPQVSASALDACLQPGSRVTPLVVSDAAAVDACLQFLDDHRMLVEPACGAALAPVYRAQGSGGAMPEALRTAASVVVIVCGGSNVKHGDLVKWQASLPRTE